MKKEIIDSRNSGLNKIAKAVIFLGLILNFLFIVNSIQAQQLTARPEQGLGAGGGYQTTNIDSISLQNGAVNLSIPLASLPPIAGGELSYTLTASYNGKLWQNNQEEKWSYPEIIDPNVPHCPRSYSTQTLTQAEGSGWQIGGSYQVFYRDAHQDYDYIAPNNDTCWTTGEFNAMQGRYFKPVLRMPDGSEHDLRFQSYIEQYPAWGVMDHMKGFYKQPGNGGPGQPIFTETAVRMYTIDGTFIAVEVNQASSLYAKIILKDGTRIELSAEGQRTIDTNGNSILQGGRIVGGILEQFVKDEQTGREIKWMDATYNSQPATKVQYQSVGGAWQDVYVVYGTTIVKGKVYGKIDWNATGGEMGTGDVCYLHEQFPDTGMDVVREIVFPSTESNIVPKYVFGYNSDETETTTDTFSEYCGMQQPHTYSRTASKGWGEISDITTPTSAHIKYEYRHDGIHTFTQTSSYDGNEVVKNVVSKKKLTHDGVTDEWLYWVPVGIPGSGYAGGVINPDGSVYTETYVPTDIAFSGTGGQDGMGGLTIKAYQNNGKTLIEKKWAALGGFTPVIGAPGQWIGINRVVDTEFTTLRDDQGNRLKMTAKKFNYDYNGNMTQVIQYGWINISNVTYTNGNNSETGVPTGVPSGTPVMRVTNTSYYNAAADASSANAYKSRNIDSALVILGMPKEATVGDGTIVKSTSELYYDGHTDLNTAPTKGNLTKSRAWDDANNQWVSTQSTYSTRGNVLTQTNANGVVTQYTYGSINGYSDLYPTQTVAAYGTTVARTSSAVYDFYTGKLVTATDVDNSLSVTTEYDILGRPTKIRNAAGTALESWRRTEYSDFNRRIIVRADLDTMGDGRKIAIEHYDQAGRLRLSRMLENAATEDPYDETSGIKIETRYLTAAPYSYQLISNPYRADSAAQASGEQSMGWKLSKTWADGSKQETETFSGAALPAPFVSSGANAASTGKASTESYGERTLVTDQAGKQRIGKVNALGQLTDVWEITSSDGSTVSVTFPGAAGSGISAGYLTSYAYDILGDLAEVHQGSQTPRSFTYNSLSRLTAAFNPESGTINYAYDANGNLANTSQLRSGTANVLTSNTYDALNRVTQRSYTTPNGTPGHYQATPTVSYTYDDKTHAKGKLTKVSSSVSTTEYTSFDLLGRVTAHKQTTDGSDYTTAYAYNLSGALVEETYPSTRKVRSTLDASGDLVEVESRKNSSSAYWSYANSLTYNAAGEVTAMRLGNGLWESTAFNARLQPTQIAVGSMPGTTNLLKLDYGYGTTQNDGNVRSQTITVPGLNQPFIQNYTYDSLNRLLSATETNNSTPTWKQSFTYDRYGNRNFDEANTTTLTKSCGTSPNFTVCTADRKKENPSIDVSNNRLSSSDNYSYDLAGNTTDDAGSQSYIYDGENKMVQASDGGGILGTYYYDGDGKRVKKVVPNGETTTFVYDASGKMVAEYSTQLNPTPQASYLISDNLGSPRINTNANGAVISRHDYHPFGEEIVSSQRSPGLGYQSDEIRKKFTGYERDSETGLDFAQARMYSSQQGRFNTADTLLGSGKIESAQTWNRYSYVLNNPVNAIDPTGLYECKASPDQCAQFKAALFDANMTLSKLDQKSKQAKAIKRAIDSYGCDASDDTCGEKGKNGVRIVDQSATTGPSDNITGDTSGGVQTEGVAHDKTIANPHGMYAVVSFDFASAANPASGVDLAQILVHEGSHVADGAEWVASGFLDSKNPSIYKTEKDAYTTQSYFVSHRASASGSYQGGIDSKGQPVNYQIWNKSWKNVDSKRETNINKIIEFTYGVTAKVSGDPTFVKDGVLPDHPKH
ncbi:MAG TPA: RHS repeat-associated core domain-containing protein [Pyrinomonadaceae bacterium]|nr:RHS repeat-associated core domain-containing protein [Pyrinomonadaceae bacterium]